MPEPIREPLDRIRIADGEHLDPAVLEIARMAAQPQRERLRAGVDAEGHALHAPGNEKPRGGHRGQPAGLASPGLASAAASMIAASSAPVTGPMKSFAMRPSGAIT